MKLVAIAATVALLAVPAALAATPTLVGTVGPGFTITLTKGGKKVAKLKAQQRNYTLLGELNARPRTTYLGAVRNPNAELEKA